MKFRFYYKIYNKKGEMKYYKDIYVENYIQAKQQIIKFIKEHHYNNDFKIIRYEKIIDNKIYTI